MILSFFSMDDSPSACSMVGCCHTSLSITGRYSDLAQGDPDCLGDRVALDLPDTMGTLDGAGKDPTFYRRWMSGGILTMWFPRLSSSNHISMMYSAPWYMGLMDCDP